MPESTATGDTQPQPASPPKADEAQTKAAAPVAKRSSKGKVLVRWLRGNECEMFTPFGADDPEDKVLLGPETPEITVDRSRVARYGRSANVPRELRGADGEHNERSYQKLRQLVQCGHAMLVLETGAEIKTLHDLITLLG